MTILVLLLFVSLIPNQTYFILVLVFLLFYNIVLAGEATLEERIVPGLLFSSQCAPQLSVTEITKCMAIAL